MRIEQRPGTHIVEEEYNITLAMSLTDTGDEVSYVLDDDGSKAEFGDDWETVKIICCAFCVSVDNHKMNSHSIEDIIKYDNILHSIGILEGIASLEKEKAIECINRIFHDYSVDRERLLKVLFGGESQGQTIDIRTHREGV